MRNYFGWLLFFSVSWWIVLLPYEYQLFSVVLDPFHTVAQSLITAIAGPVPFYSDSSGMYLLLIVCPVLGVLTAGLMLLPVFRKFRNKGFYLAKTVMTWFLVLELWKYGWIKLIKLQFYLPEPNTVYSSLGGLSKDIAYWSVIGSSHSYVVFMGITELIAGVLLLLPRTRFPGLLLALGIFINVVMVNFSFDISVKLFSLTSLLMVAIVLTGYRNQFRYMLQLPVKPVVRENRTRHPWENWLVALVVSLFVVESVYPAVVMESMNDDTLERPEHHGAYTIAAHPQLERLYIHRKDYVIFENREGAQLDFRIKAKNGENWSLIDERTQKESTLSWNSPQEAILQHDRISDTLSLKLMPYRDLPLLRKSFHWISDEFH